jgi:hypothetical protein
LRVVRFLKITRVARIVAVIRSGRFAQVYDVMMRFREY